MPKVTLVLPHGLVSRSDDLKEAGKQIIPLVAAACSTADVTLTERDVDWVISEPCSGSIHGVSVELLTIGYPKRVRRLSKKNLIILRDQIGAILRKVHNLHDVKNESLLWVLLADPRGRHV